MQSLEGGVPVHLIRVRPPRVDRLAQPVHSLWPLSLQCRQASEIVERFSGVPVDVTEHAFPRLEDLEEQRLGRGVASLLGVQDGQENQV